MNSKIHQKNIRITFPYLLLFLFFLFFLSLPVEATRDTTAPTITNLSLDKSVVHPGDRLAFSFHLDESESGLRSFLFALRFSSNLVEGPGIDFSIANYPSRLNGNIYYGYSSSLEDNHSYLYSGDFTFYINITDKTVPGLYQFGKFESVDGVGNTSTCTFDSGIFLRVENPNYYKKYLPNILEVKVKTKPEIYFDDSLEVDIRLDGNADTICRVSILYEETDYYYEHGELPVSARYRYDFFYNPCPVTKDTDSTSILHLTYGPKTSGLGLMLQKDYQLKYLEVTYYSDDQSVLYTYDPDSNLWRVKENGYTCTNSGYNHIRYVDNTYPSMPKSNKPFKDYEAPVLHSIKVINKTAYLPYDYLTLSVDATDNVKVTDFTFEITRKGSDQIISDYYWLDKMSVEKDGSIRAQIDISPSNILVGEYVISIQVRDEDFNWSNKLSASFQVKDALLEDYNVVYDCGSGNPDLIPHLNALKSGQSARILCEQHSPNGTIPKKVFQAIQGRDVYLIIEKDYYVWIFYGKDITQAKDVKVDMSMGESFIYPGTLQITFPSNGSLPGKMRVRFRSIHICNIYNTTGTLYFYYLDENTGKLIQDPKSKPTYVIKGINHWCYFDFYHHSTYYLSGRKLIDKSTSVTVKKETTVKTTATKAKTVPVKKPGRVTWIKLKKKSKGKMYLSWNKSKYATGYEIIYSTNKKFKKNTKKKTVNNSQHITLTLKKKKVYYVRIRAFAKITSKAQRKKYGKYIYSAYSPVKKMKR